MINPDGREIVNTNAKGMAKIDVEKVGNLGEWERERFRVSEDPENKTEVDRLDEFKTYGAKKYWYRTGEVCHITVAGLPAKTPEGVPIDKRKESFVLGHTW
jgi:hypothetical protein